MNNKRNIFILIIGCFIALFISIHVFNDDNNNENPGIVENVAVNIQEAFNNIFSFIPDVLNGFNEMLDLQDEYHTLKTIVDDYNNLLAENEALKAENEALKDQLSLNSTPTGYVGVNASVVYRNVDGWNDILTIDAGSNDGIEVGDAVISSNGLVGLVSSVSKDQADVQLLTNTETKNKVAVKVGNVNGLIDSYDIEQDLFKIMSAEDTSSIKAGDKVYTNGLGGKYPSGLYVGEVVKVEKDKYGLSNVIYVKSAVDFSDIQFVTVIKEEEE